MNTFIHHEGSTYIQYSKIKKKEKEEKKSEWLGSDTQCEGRTDRRQEWPSALVRSIVVRRAPIEFILNA